MLRVHAFSETRLRATEQGDVALCLFSERNDS